MRRFRSSRFLQKMEAYRAGMPTDYTVAAAKGRDVWLGGSSKGSTVDTVLSGVCGAAYQYWQMWKACSLIEQLPVFPEHSRVEGGDADRVHLCSKQEGRGKARRIAETYEVQQEDRTKDSRNRGVG